MKELLIICPVDAGRLVGGGRVRSRLLVEDSGTLVTLQVLIEAHLELSERSEGLWLLSVTGGRCASLSESLSTTSTCQLRQQSGEEKLLPVFIMSYGPTALCVSELSRTPAI